MVCDFSLASENEFFSKIHKTGIMALLSSPRLFVSSLHPLDEEIMQYSLCTKIKSTPIVITDSLISSISLKEQREASPERQARLWGYRFGTAKRTLEATTHKVYREYINSTWSLTRKF